MNGPFSLALLDPLKALMLEYQEDGNPVLADAMLEQALQIVRVNLGLSSLEQVPLLGQRIRNEERRGNFTAAWETEQALLRLASRNPGDVRTIPVLREIAAKRMTTLEDYRGGQFPPQIRLGCFYSPMRNPNLGSCDSGQRSAVEANLLADAEQHYRAAIDVLVRNRNYTSDELRELEAEIVADSYRYARYAAGRRSLLRSLDYALVSSATWLEALTRTTEIGDWDVLFGEYPLGTKVYEQTLEQLSAKGVEQSAVDALFSPSLPVVLPSFLPNPLATRPTRPDAPFIDIGFEVSRFGRGRKVEILPTTTARDKSAQRALVILIERSRFRPRVVAGKLDDTRAVVRYFPGSSGIPAPPKLRRTHGS